MRMKSVLVISFLLMIATTGAVHTPQSFGDQGQGAVVSQRVGHGGSAYSSYIFDGGVDCKFKAAKIPSVTDSERIGHGGSLYSYSGLTSDAAKDCEAKNPRVIAKERIGHGGSAYYSSETMTN